MVILRDAISAANGGLAAALTRGEVESLVRDLVLELEAQFGDIDTISGRLDNPISPKAAGIVQEILSERRRILEGRM